MEKPTRAELIELLREHISIRVKVGQEHVYGGFGPRVRVELIINSTTSEEEVVISSDYADLSDASTL